MTKKRAESLALMFMLFSLFTLWSMTSLAEQAGEIHEGGIPKVVFYEALNFGGLILILYFSLRKKVAGHFVKRHDDLTAQIREAKALKDAAEAKYKEYAAKIQSLESEASQILDQIRKEGEASKNKIIAEAKTLAGTIQVEAKRSAENEVQKAKTELYDEVLLQALEGARHLLTKSVVEKDQLRLQKEFVEKIEAVQ